MGKKKKHQTAGIAVCFCSSADLTDENIEGMANTVFEQMEGLRESGADRFGGVLILPEGPDGFEAFSRLIGRMTAAGLEAMTTGSEDAFVPPDQLN